MSLSFLRLSMSKSTWHGHTSISSKIWKQYKWTCKSSHYSYWLQSLANCCCLTLTLNLNLLFKVRVKLGIRVRFELRVMVWIGLRVRVRLMLIITPHSLNTFAWRSNITSYSRWDPFGQRLIVTSFILAEILPFYLFLSLHTQSTLGYPLATLGFWPTTESAFGRLQSRPLAEGRLK